MADLTWLIGGIAFLFAIIAWLWVIGVFGAIVGSLRAFFGPRSDWVKDADLYALPKGWGERQLGDSPVDDAPENRPEAPREDH